MANLLTRKVMENMSRQYRKENGISSTTSNGQGRRGNLNAGEEKFLLGLIRNNSTHMKIDNTKRQSPQSIKTINLDDLIGYSKPSVDKVVKSSSTITLDELAKKQGK